MTIDPGYSEAERLTLSRQVAWDKIVSIQLSPSMHWDHADGVAGSSSWKIIWIFIKDGPH